MGLALKGLRNFWNSQFCCNISQLHDHLRKKKWDVSLPYLFTRSILREENKGQVDLKELIKSHSFSEIFYCCMTRFRDTNSAVFWQHPYRRSNFKKNNMGQVNLRNFLNSSFREILYFGTNRLNDTDSSVFRWHLLSGTTLRKENMMGQTTIKKLYKFHNFSEICYWNMTRNHEHELGVFFDNIYTQKIL